MKKEEMSKSDRNLDLESVWRLLMMPTTSVSLRERLWDNGGEHHWFLLSAYIIWSPYFSLSVSYCEIQYVVKSSNFLNALLSCIIWEFLLLLV